MRLRLDFTHDNLEGWIPELATDAEVFDAFEKAFDYRGDIVITRKDGSKLEGYIFDRKTGKSLEDSMVRLYPATSNEKLSIPYAEIARLEFGKDRAAGSTGKPGLRSIRRRRRPGRRTSASCRTLWS